MCVCFFLDCSSLSRPANGRVVIEGGTATYTCNLGYTLHGSSVRKCSGGRWSGYASTCIRSNNILIKYLLSDGLLYCFFDSRVMWKTP